MLNKKYIKLLSSICTLSLIWLGFIYYKSFDKKEKQRLDNAIKDSPLIFIGGYARSGTTLMRAILDVHPLISCGPETKVIPAITKFIFEYLNKTDIKNDLKSAGIQIESINNGLSMFIHHILNNHIHSAERLCAKDPDILYYMDYLHELFPKAKFIYMVRDGRDVAWSMMKKLKLNNKFSIFVKYLDTWNSFNEYISEHCANTGVDSCLNVKYEDLVLNPEQTLIKVAQFLGIEWTDDFLRHDQFIGNKIAVSDLEWSTDQVKKPIYKDSINKWAGNVKDYDKLIVNNIALMLNSFGYTN